MIKYSDIEVTGSITVLGSITGSLLGTASAAETASYILTASYALTSGTNASVTSSYSVSASYAITASYAATASHAVTSSYAVTASHAITASFAESASYAVNSLLSNFAITTGYVPTASHIAANDIGGEFFEWNSLTNPTGSGGVLGGTATYLGTTLGTRLIANNQTFNNGRCFWQRDYDWTTADIKTRVAMRMGSGTGDYFAIHLGCSGPVTVSDPNASTGQTQGGLYIQIHQFNKTISITAGNNLATVSTGMEEALFNPDDTSPVNVDVIVKWKKNTGRRICEVLIDGVWVIELDITGWTPAGNFYGLTAKNGGAANWHDFRYFAITSYQDEYSYWTDQAITASIAATSSFAETASLALTASYSPRALQTDYALVASHIAANEIGDDFLYWNATTNPSTTGGVLGGAATYPSVSTGVRLTTSGTTFSQGRIFWTGSYDWTTADIRVRAAVRNATQSGGDYTDIYIGSSGVISGSWPEGATLLGALQVKLNDYDNRVEIRLPNGTSRVIDIAGEMLTPGNGPTNVDVILKWKKNTNNRICEVRLDDVWIGELDITNWTPGGRFFGIAAWNGGATNTHEVRSFEVSSYQDGYSYWVTATDTASYARIADSASFAYTASYVPSSSYALRANYATSASYADGAYVNFLSSGSGAVVQTAPDIWESEMIRLDLENQANPGRLVIGGSSRNSYRVYWYPTDQTYPANINQNNYGISKYGIIKVGANAQNSLPLGAEDNGIPYINAELDIAGTAGPNKPVPFGVNRVFTIRDVVNSQGEFSFMYWGGDDGNGQRFEMRFSGGNKLRLIPAYSADNSQAYNEVYQTDQGAVATNVLNYATTRPWGYYSGRINQIFQWRVRRSGSNLVSEFRCNGSQNWITLRTVAATTFQGMWDGSVTVNNWWAWQWSKGFAWSTSTNTFDDLYLKMSQSEFPMHI